MGWWNWDDYRMYPLAIKPGKNPVSMEFLSAGLSRCHVWKNRTALDGMFGRASSQPFSQQWHDHWILRYCKNYPSRSEFLVGGLEPWNFMTFHSSWEFHHPTDGYSTPSFFRGVGRKTTNQFCWGVIGIQFTHWPSHPTNSRPNSPNHPSSSQRDFFFRSTTIPCARKWWLISYL